MAAVSSMGPSYKVSVRYFCATIGEGSFDTIIESKVSAALIQICIVRFIKGLPSNALSSPFRTMPSVVIIFPYFSLSAFMMARMSCAIGPMMNADKEKYGKMMTTLGIVLKGDDRSLEGKPLMKR